jgi:tellurite resistance protein TerA
MTNLAMGANTALPSTKFTLDVFFSNDAQVEVTALQIYADGKVRGDGDMCFFNQTVISKGAVSLTIKGESQNFTFNLEKIDTDVEKIVLCAAVNSISFSSVHDLKVSNLSGIDMFIETSGRSESALILCEIYRRNHQWKIRNVSQGFNGGLQALAEHFGVNIASPENSKVDLETFAQQRPALPKPINLSKISLTNNENTVLLKTGDSKFGLIRVNLNWNHKQKAGGLFGLGKEAINLDLGAFVELQDGHIHCVQARGNSYGDLSAPPYTKLMGNDRAGISTDGEWLEIDGDFWTSFKRILICAYIYEGTSNWQKTARILRMMAPNQPEVEVQINELNTNKQETMCAVLLLENQNDQIFVRREIRFFEGIKNGQ